MEEWAGRETGRALTAEERLSLPEASADTRLVEPQTEEGILEVLARARSEGLSVVPWGQGHRQRYGEPLSRVDIVLSLRRLGGIREDGLSEGYMGVWAGTPLEELVVRIKAGGQVVGPLAGMVSRGTVGGFLASGLSGPHRLFHGGARDSVLGLRVALADGRLVRTGGRVVKNVAGYDLTRLFTGSLGTLGVITAAYLRVWPLPKARRSIVIRVRKGLFEGRDGDFGPGRKAAILRLGQVALNILERGLEPAALEVVAGRLAPDGPDAGSLRDGRSMDPLEGASLWADFLLGERAAERAFRETREMAEAAGCEVTLLASDADAEALWSRLETVLSEWSRVALRLSLPPGEALGGALEALNRLDPPGSAQAGVLVTAGLGTGLVRAYLLGERSSLEGVGDLASPADPNRGSEEAILQLRDWTETHRGALVVEDAPLSLRARVGTWGYRVPLATRGLTQRLKETLDPGLILAPGRMVQVEGTLAEDGRPEGEAR